MLCFLDLETTGLDETHHSILEIALAVTDDNLKILNECSWLCTEHLFERLSKMEPLVRQMHLDNGLLLDLMKVGDNKDLVGGWRLEVRNWLEEVAWNAVQTGNLTCSDEWLSKSMDSNGIPPPQYFPLLKTVPLAGSTVSFDRRFLRYHFPDLDNMFHYRSVDVSSIKELVNRWYPERGGFRWISPEKKPHRALDDVRASIAELAHYRHHVFTSDGSTEREWWRD